MSPTSTDQALEMLTAALGYLAAADATAMTAEEQARCLRVLERATAIGTAARTSMLGAFTSGRGYSADAQYSAKAWLVYKTGVTKGAAASHTAWMRRALEHPAVFAAMAAGDAVGAGGPAPVPVDRQDSRSAPGRRGHDPGRCGRGGDGPAGPGRAIRRDLRALPARGPQPG